MKNFTNIGSLRIGDEVMLSQVDSVIEQLESQSEYTAFEVFPTSADIPAGTTTDIKAPVDEWVNPIPSSPYRAYQTAMAYNEKYYIVIEDTTDIFPDESTDWQEVTELYEPRVYNAGDIVLYKTNNTVQVFVRKDTSPGEKNVPTVSRLWTRCSMLKQPWYNTGDVVAIAEQEKIYTCLAQHVTAKPGESEGWKNYWSEGAEGYDGYFYVYKQTVPANMVLRLQFYSYKSSRDDCNVVIDWGDGTQSTAKKNPSWTYYQDPYNYSLFEIAHQYSQQGKYIVKVLGNDYFMLRNGSIDANPIISRVFDSDLPMASCLKNVSSLCLNNSRLIKIDMPYGYKFYGVHLISMFQNCKNLRYVKISQGSFLGKLQAVSKIFQDCQNLQMDINGLSPLFANWFEAPDMSYVFYNCSGLKGTVNPKMFWENPGNMLVPATNTDNMFVGCSSTIRPQVPPEWGGTKTPEPQPINEQYIAYPSSIDGNMQLICKNGLIEDVAAVSQHALKLTVDIPEDNYDYSLCTLLKQNSKQYAFVKYGDSQSLSSRCFIQSEDNMRYTYKDAGTYNVAIRTDNYADGITCIPENCFINESITQSMSIPSTVLSIADNAITYMAALSSVEFEEGIQLSSMPTAFGKYCSSIKHLKIPNGVKYINSSLLFNTPKIEYVYFPPSVSAMGDYILRNAQSTSTYTSRYALFIDHENVVTSDGGGSFFGYNNNNPAANRLYIVVPDELCTVWGETWDDSALKSRTKFLCKFSAVSADLLSKGIIDENGHIA